VRSAYLIVPLVFALAPALAAQDKPTPAMQESLKGKWVLDAARSDPLPADPLAGAAGGGAVGMGGGRSSGGGGGGGGGGGKGKGGSGGASSSGAATTTTSPAPDPNQAPQGFGRNRDPHLAMVIADVNPGAGMFIGVNDSVVAIATAAMLKADPNAQSNWKTDGKKHQEAQMDGSITEIESTWKDGVLTISYGVAGVATFKREFKPGKDGKTLEVKETVESNGRKAEYKLLFNRT
jgi:hypothetical protein